LLLLVLILVLVAFGLLVVALLTSSVPWAWVSVGMSVAAASALLVDWLQRQSAIRDETEDGVAASAGLEARPVELVDIEPVTELIPVVRPSDSTAQRPIGNGVAPGYSDDTRSAEFFDPRFNPARDAEQTVVMPIVQPFGSRELPPGATSGTASVGGDSSLSVTFPAPEDSGYEPGLHGEWALPDRAAVTTEATDAVERADEGEADTGSRTDPGTATGTGRAPMSGSEVGSVSPQNGAAAGMTAAVVSTSEPVGRSEEAGPEPVAARSDPDLDPSMLVPDARQGPAENDDGEDDTTTIVCHSRGTVAEQSGSFLTPPDRPGADPEATVIVRKVTPVAAPLPPAGPDGEPPEEPSDAAAAEIIARLENQVVVVDERPRYHLPTCPSVAAHPLIPLPVREAVEYGFTPCGWCAPNRALGDRHRTTTS